MPKSDAPDPLPVSNKLLAALPRAEYERLRPDLEVVSLASKTVLDQPGQPVGHVYFPTSAVLSVLALVEEGWSIEVGLVGREGMAGLAVFLGLETSAARVIVQVPGQALRMRAGTFHDRVARDSRLHELLLRYTHAFLTQLAQSVACNSLHPVEKRLCRWLLMVQTRVGSDRFPLTHEFLATMLGIRRASVTKAAQGLQQAGLIRYGRGQLTVLDREGLEATACGCHRVVQAEMDRLHGDDRRG